MRAVAAALTLLALAANGARAQTPSWPTRAATIISPFSAGSGVDLLARHIGNELQDKLGQPFIVDDRAGANGDVGAAYAAKAAPDGYTLLIVTPGIAVQNKYVYATMPFDFERDFSPIALVAKAPMLVMVNPSLPVHTLAELIAYAKANPGKVRVSSTGVGSQPHVTLEMIKGMAGVDMTHVPYNSAGQQNTDLIAGQIEAGINYVTTTIGLVKAGSARALATTGATRLADLPDVPTMREAGFPGFEAVGWYGIFAPRGTPDIVGAKVNKVVNDWLASDRSIAPLRDLGMQPAGGSADDLRAWMAAEENRWGALMKRVIVPQ